jgi:hypothetical protein
VASVKQYTIKIWQAQKKIAAALGTDITTGGVADRARAISSDAVLAILIKTLTDAGVITDAQLNAALLAASQLSIPPLPPEVVVTSDDPPAPDPDLGV